MNYKRLNIIIGWLVFAIAAVTYCLTIEPTASFWDCPEFITTGYKMEVGHPPGAPIFMLTANLFSQFTSDPSKVAMMVNIMSALLSALCILFLFWSITMLVKKLVAGTKDPDMWQMITIFGAGIVGALAYTWSDTFWFSAVEGEVYAYSSFCTAVTFWLILKWEENADQPHSARWLVLITYLIGVSVGVHLLNLLCITAIVLVYYFKKSENPTWKGGIIAFILSGVIIAAILYGIVPGIVKVGGSSTVRSSANHSKNPKTTSTSARNNAAGTSTSSRNTASMPSSLATPTATTPPKSQVSVSTPPIQSAKPLNTASPASTSSKSARSASK